MGWLSGILGRSSKLAPTAPLPPASPLFQTRQPSAPATVAAPEAAPAPPAAPEEIRLIVWDLDDVFWHGTLTEGGIIYRQDMHDLVVDLAKRGIISSICSKNNIDEVQAVLTAHGIWEYFVFPSVDWSPKGRRLAALVADMQLRPASVLFIDDNPMNRAEAEQAVPGLRVASDMVLAGMRDDPLLRGKPDPDLTRLAQYRLLQRRQADAATTGGDNIAFLRASDIRVTIEHDIGPHIDRALDLIARTNQLNFTKFRLRKDPAQAEAQLRDLLTRHPIQAGIVHVRDRYGDYGYCGLYIMRSAAEGRVLQHFCFSCRILNMGVETWMYNRLGRPDIAIRGDVVVDLLGDTRNIDWITLTPPGTSDDTLPSAPVIDTIYARGSCDLFAVTHYFQMLAKNIHCDFNTARDGVGLALQHSVIARYAMDGIDPAALDAFVPLGFVAKDFKSIVTTRPGGKNSFWILSFWGEAQHTLWRHRSTFALIPYRIPPPLKPGEEETPEAAERRRYLRQNFEPIGLIDEASFKENFTALLRLAPEGTKIFMLLMNDMRKIPDNKGELVVEKDRRVNDWTRDIAASHSNVELVDMVDFAKTQDEIGVSNHFDRMVYYRIAQHVLQRAQA